MCWIKFIILAVLCVWALLTTSTRASALCTWEGTVSPDWHNAENWSGCGVPSASDDVVVPDQFAANEPTVSSGDAACHSLTLASARTLTVAGPRVLTVYGTAVPATLVNSATLTGSG